MSQASTQSSQALKHYFQQDEIPSDLGRLLIIQGVPGAWLEHLQYQSLEVITHLANDKQDWAEAGQQALQACDQEFDTIIHFASKFATENLTKLGKYCQQRAPQGRWISVVPNRMGASRLKRDISKLFEAVDTCSKAKCRIFDSSSPHDRSLARKWHSLSKPKPMKGTELVTTPGIFSAEKVDTGSKILAEFLQKESFYGSGADLGAGYGFLSKTVLEIPRQRIRELVLFELDQRALDCAQQNLAGHDNALYKWCDVTAGAMHERAFDWVIMNPPFHDAQDQSFALGKSFIREAARILKPGGVLYIVANLHLPYEDLMANEFRSQRLLAERDGFKCFMARK
ncbi:class I SAM-dependent methyltransferase [Rubritalea marina]|uniref:class I SAM-dependent methyltransferase n=1 Tax=Rubritalea marina TaxID=361055 RepID=UPI00035FFEF1|nr:methyltransferase [Rubritalea marina]